ncbi:UDP-N-acetylmuramate dehydrogenase [Nocardioides sp. dk4132]|uniref:UDP-N-acetylmuramate dehydrogenase n=1 Tax=unclassified Nocardioides TaxID=2615069 RepID=UPI001295C587|nr:MULTISPECIES: UDP-N-acetylmuramate dehydrogenase [unclassified Nocardioides]MQW74540.1 UDP-N-acetylmuramate dehydrogenase [Nocardioides sp. dk4132]QGA06464.1 UDP-N-acetylmuramate dehydrogenase [Nocardioides sp. dk884]
MPESLHLLRDHTTLRVGGPAARWVRASTEDEAVAAVSAADDRGEPVLVLGGGSNLLVADEGFPGTVVELAMDDVSVEGDDDGPACGGVSVTAGAGTGWDDLVALACERGWVGVEALSGIPGTVGATPVQNVGAYGQEVAQTIARVRTWDRVERRVRSFAAADCGFGYRSSRFKSDPARHVVLTVTFQLRTGDLSAPVAYAELARTLGVESGQRAPLADVRAAVLGLRAGKGMVLDPDDHDTWSAGSFFTNPILPADRIPEGAPAWPLADGQVKTSAAWLIEHAGFTKGYGGPAASLSTKHTLALTNRGGASAADVLALAREVRDGVEARFGIRLVNEPVLVGCGL